MSIDEIDQLIKEMQDQIDYYNEEFGDKDLMTYKSWATQVGVLITGKQAMFLIEILKSNRTK